MRPSLRRSVSFCTDVNTSQANGRDAFLLFQNERKLVPPFNSSNECKAAIRMLCYGGRV